MGKRCSLFFISRLRQRHAHRQPAPGDAAGARHLVGHAAHQRFVLRERGAVAGGTLADGGDAGIGDAQRLAAEGAALALEQTGGEQFGFQHVKHRPAGRAVHLAQALGVAAGDVHVGEIVARSGAAHATACDIAPAKPGLWLKRLRCRGDEDTPIIL